MVLYYYTIVVEFFFLSNNLQLRTNIGTAWRAPHVNELYSEGLHHGAAAVEEGNPELESEKSVKWITSLEKNTEKDRPEVFRLRILSSQRA